VGAAVTPAPLPATSYCAAGWADPALLRHESALVELHRNGSVHLIDRGGLGADVIRWRMTWGQGSSSVRASLCVSAADTDDEDVRFWLYAEAKRPWEIRNQVSVPERLRLLDLGLKDPSSRFSLTQRNELVGLTDVAFLEFTLNADMRDSPVLVHHCGSDPVLNQQMLRFRNATRGLCGLLPIDDAGRDQVNSLLPEARRIPRRAARLYLPPWWTEDLDDVVIPEDLLDRPGEWRKLVETVVRVNSWRNGGRIPLTGIGWPSLLHDPMQDERVVPETRGSGVRWLPAPDDTGRQVLRKRLDAAHDRARKVEQAAESVSALVEQRTAEAHALAQSVRKAQRSRQRLASLTQRLRRERDTAESALRSRSVADAWSEARDAEVESALYAEELDRAEEERHRLRHRVGWLTERLDGRTETAADVTEAPSFAGFAELVATAQREFCGLAFGPRVAATGLDGHLRSDQWLRRTWDVLELLDAYARARQATADRGDAALRGFAYYVKENGGERGISPTLVASGESEMVVNTPRFRNARTFPVPTEIHPSGWEFFGAHVKIDRGGGVAPRLHYLDDTAGPTGLVHVGYLGPHLPSPETN
jgi:hypothetical protein